MTVGRISGPLLKANLLRDGVDLAFENDLLYLDVSNPNPANHRVGIKNSNPAYTFDVTGTIRADTYIGGILTIDDVEINNNEISSTIGNLLINPATSTDRVVIGPAEIPQIYGDVDIQGNIYAFNLDLNALVTEELTVGNIFINGDDQNSKISTTASNTNLYLDAAGTGTINLTSPTIITGDLTVSQDLILQGGDITTTAFTASLFNSVATTVNIGNQATLISLGFTSGTTNVRNNLDVDGDISLDGGDLISTATTFNLANITASTINFGGEATAINIGAFLGTTTVRNNLTVNGITSLLDTGVAGNLNVTGDAAAAGNLTVNGNITSDQSVTATSLFTDGIEIVGANINAISSNADLELGTSGSGIIQLKTDVNIDGNLTINGAGLYSNNLTSIASTFDLLNTTVQTINFGGDATAINIGNSSGTTLIRHNLQVDGDLTLNGQDLFVGNIWINGDAQSSTISSFNSNTNLYIDAAGTGVVEITSNTNITGSLAVNNSAITTNQATFNLINANATTVNFAGAATTLEIGAATGTTNINNNLDVDGDINIDGGDLTVTGTSFNLANDTVSNVNAFGAASTLNLGATSGTTTIRTSNTTISGDLQVQGGDLTSSASTFNLLTGVNPQTVNFATGATTLVIGALTGTATLQNAVVTTPGRLIITKANSVTTGEGQIFLNGATGNRIEWNSNGIAAPSTAARSLGTKLVLYPNVGVSSYLDSAIGVETDHMWFSSPKPTDGFKWYSGSETAAATLEGSGNFSLTGNLAVNGGSITTTASNFNLVNTTATTVNFGGSATTVNIGSTTGTTYIKHNLNVANGKLTFNGTTLSVDGDIDVSGNVNIGGNITIGNQTLDTVTVIADFTSNLIPDASNTYDLGTTLKSWRNIYADSANFNSIYLPDISISGNTITTTQSNSNLEFNAAGTGTIELLTSTNVTGNLDVTGALTAGTFSVNSIVAPTIATTTITADTGNITTINSTTVNSTNIDADRIYFNYLSNDTIEISGNSIITTVSNADLELNAAGTGIIELLTNTNVTGSLDVSSQATLASANIEDLTAGRIVLAGLNGELEDSANLTFDGTTLGVNGNIDVSGNVNIGGNITIGNQTLDTVTVIADFTSDLIPNTSNTYDLGKSFQQWKNIFVNDVYSGALYLNDIKISGNTITTTQSDSDLQLDAAGTGVIELLTNTELTGTLTVNPGSTALSINSNAITRANADFYLQAGSSGFVSDRSYIQLLNNSGVKIYGGNTGTTGDIVLDGGASDVFVFKSTQSTSISTGALKIEGGLGVKRNVNIGENLSVIGNFDLNGAITSDFVPESAFTYSLGSAASPWNIVYADELNLDQISIKDNIISTTQSNTNLEINTSGTGSIELLADTNITGTLDVSTQANLASARVEDLTAGRVVLAGVGGELEDSANLTFDGTNLNVNGNIDVSGNVSIGGNITIGNQTMDTITVVADFTSDLIPDVDNIYNLGTDSKRWNTLNVGKIDVGNLQISSTMIASTDSDADIELRPAGVGRVYANTNLLDVTGDIKANSIVDTIIDCGTY